MESKAIGKFSQHDTKGTKNDKNREPFVCKKFAHSAKIIQK